MSASDYLSVPSRFSTNSSSTDFSRMIVIIFLISCFISGCAIEDKLLVGPQAKLISRMNGLLKQVAASYFTVLVHKQQQSTSGSGFVVDASGYIVTAGHVAEMVGNVVQVQGIDQQVYQGKVIAVQHFPDMALLKLDGFKGKSVTPIVQPCIKKGSPMFSIGNPRLERNTVRIGMLSSIHSQDYTSYHGFGYPDAMEITLGTQVGESGGPLFTEQARLAGMMVSAIYTEDGLAKRAHAIPSTMIAKFFCAKFNCALNWKKLSAIQYQNC